VREGEGRSYRSNVYKPPSMAPQGSRGHLGRRVIILGCLGCRHNLFHFPKMSWRGPTPCTDRGS
jgi:hypothetical protein